MIGKEESADPAATAEEEKIISHYCNICGVKCNLACSKCKSAFYCSVEHQKQESAQHKRKCKHLRSVADDDKDSDFTVEFSGNIDDKWGQSANFCYSKHMSERDKKAVCGSDRGEAERTVRRLQEEMYLGNKESLNTLRKWRCCRYPTPPLVWPSCCGGGIAKCVVMWHAEMSVKLLPKMKKLTCNAPYGLFPLCTECINKNYDNAPLANTGKGKGLDTRLLRYREK